LGEELAPVALTVITRPRKIRRFLTFDLEWYPGETLPEGPALDTKTRLPVRFDVTRPLRLRMVGVYDGERYRCYRTMAEFLASELVKKNRGAWFYAHAGGLADIEFVFDEILRWNAKASARKAYKVKASFSGSSAIIVHARRGKSSFHFVDSYWLLRDKLASIGKALRLPKLGEEKRQTRAEAADYYRRTPDEELVPYNERDCVILWKAISEFENTILELGGQLQMTIAGTAMHLFRRRYLRDTISTSAKVNDLARAAYFASRVEVYNRSAEDFFIYDINSSFPFAMTFPCPGNLIRNGEKLPDRDDDECIYLADVTVEVPEMYLPPVPFRLDGRVFFPVGRWRTWLDSTDVRLLLREGGRIVRVHDVLEFEPRMELADYAREIYARRKKEETDFGRLVYKYLGNALYGKFGESPFKQSLLIMPKKIRRGEEFDERGVRQKPMRMLMPGVWLDEVKVPIAHMHVPISCHITAIARRTQYDFIKQALNQGEDVHYTDTDSVATRATLPTSDELGALKLEKRIEEAVFAAPKVYGGKGEELQKDGTWKPVTIARAKGFSLPPDPREARAMLDKLIEGGEIEFQRMARLRELYAMGESRPVEILVRKVLRGLMLGKRLHYPDGTSRPWTVEELRSGDHLPPWEAEVPGGARTSEPLSVESGMFDDDEEMRA
jgi:hypothetical protein